MNLLIKELKKILAKYYNVWYFRRYRNQPVKQVFQNIYLQNSWRSIDTISGPGSEEDQTAALVLTLPRLFDRYQVQSLLDLPCGDWNWMQKTNLKGLEYTGADIVPEIIEHNRQNFQNKSIKFITLDLISESLQKHDMILNRDCLVHFSYSDVFKALINLIRSESKYLLTTTFPGRENYDITTGGWRPIDLQGEPFNFPQPIELINENCTEGRGSYQDKCLALWALNDLKGLVPDACLKLP